MPNFQATFLSPSTGYPDITLINGNIVITDNSNYNTNTEVLTHSQDKFNLFRKVGVLLPTGVTYLFSSLYPTDGNVITLVPNGNTLPLVDNYTVSADGGFRITLYTVPTFDNRGLLTYIGTTTNPVCVYYNSKFYKTTKTTANLPTVTADWTEITHIDNLPTKYRAVINIATVCNLIKSFNASVVKAAHSTNCKSCEDICHSKDYQAAVKLLMIKEAIPVLLNDSDIKGVNNLINQANMINNCGCNKLTNDTYTESGCIYIQGVDPCAGTSSIQSEENLLR